MIPLGQSITYYSTQDGNWTDPDIWNETGYPTSLDDTVYVDHHIRITPNLQINATNIYIGSTGILNVSEGVDIVFNDSFDGGFGTIDGILYIDGNPNNKITINIDGIFPTNYWNAGLKNGGLWYAKHAIFDRHCGYYCTFTYHMYGKVVWNDLNFSDQYSYISLIGLDAGSSITNSDFSQNWVMTSLTDAVMINNNSLTNIDLRNSNKATLDNMRVTGLTLRENNNATFNNLSDTGGIFVAYNARNTYLYCKNCNFGSQINFQQEETTYYRRFYFNNSNFSVTNWDYVKVPGSYIVSKNHNNTANSWHGWLYQMSSSNIPQKYKYEAEDTVVMNGGDLTFDEYTQVNNLGVLDGNIEVNNYDLVSSHIIVDSNGRFACESSTITLNGDFNISGEVTMNNCSVRINASYDGEFGINVLGGELNIVNGSSVTYGDVVMHWNMNIDEANVYVFESSTFAYGNNTGEKVINLINCIDGGNNLPIDMWNWGGGYCGDYSGVGDWIINDILYCKNEIIPLNGNLMIENGGNLTFSDITLKIDNNYDGERRIEVKNSGRFNVMNQSLITSTDSQFEYIFEVQPGASFDIDNSQVEECGWNETHRGPTINTEYANITNSNFTNNYYGLYLRYANYTKIENNFFDTNNTNGDIGIHIYKSSGNYIKNNIINSNKTGIILNLSSNNQIMNNTPNSNDEYGIYLYYSSNNTLTDNKANSNVYGIYLLESPDNFLMNNIVNSNARGIYLRDSLNNTLTKNTVNSNNNIGIYLYSSSSNNMIENTANSNNIGIYLVNSSKNTLTSNTANDNDRYWLNGIGYGIYLRESSNNILINNTANSNAYYRQDYGIYLESSSNNNLTDNSLKNNNLYDIFVWVDSDAHCNNIIENTIGTGDWPIKYFNYSATLQDEILSELILCNADNSYIDNITVTVSGDKKNNGILILRTENSNLSNIKSLRNRGFYLYNSSSNTLINNNLTLNNYGFYFSHSSNNTLTNNTANSNRYGGVYFSFSSSNTLTNNTVNSNNNAGIYLHEGSNNNTLTKNIVSLNDYGIYLESSSNNDLIDNTVILNYDNGILLISSTGNSLTNNVVDSNDWGIRLIFSSSNTLTNNTANSNRYGGIYLEDSSDETPSFDVGAGESSESGNTYYVSTNGNDTNLGTEDYPWRTITYAAIQAQAGDTVYIKSGDYGDEHVVISNSGTKGNPIVFQGYKDIPGDIPGSDEMPLINGTLKYGGGSTILIEGKKYITIRNIKVNRNDRGIFMKEGSEHLTLDNIIVTNADAEGIALEKSRYSNIRNCNVTDSGMTNIVIRESNYNVIENCSSYEVTTTPGAATDYHIGISEGHDNILRNCMAVNTRPGHAVLAGHAIGIKDTFSYHTQEYTETHSYNNKIIDCMSYNTGSEVWVSHGAHHNEFINYNIVCDQGACGSFVVRDGAYSNKFTNCRGSRAILVDGTEGMLGQIQKDNIFVNCIFDGQGITFNRAENNTIKNCVITNAAYFYYLRNENKDNIITNCIVNNVDFYINTVSGASGEPTITYTDFYNNGFDTPVGTGNIEVNPLFVDPENGDYHLKSEYGRWDGLSWVYDAETSPCIDAGNPTDDYCYEPQSNGGRINMGAYGNTDEASKSSSSGECEDLIYTASNNNISSNEFINNTQYGAYLHGSGYNIFWLNNFTDNGFNAYEEPVSLSNDWNITDTGNYWDDFTSNPGYPDNYTIPGPGDGIDYHPLNEICYLPWDVTGDGYVGIDDIVSVAEHFGESPGHPDWDPVYDVNDDDYVGIDDIVEVAEHFGESC